MRIKQVLLIELDTDYMLVIPRSHIVLELRGHRILLPYERALKIIEAFKVAEKVLKEGGKQ